MRELSETEVIAAENPQTVTSSKVVLSVLNTGFPEAVTVMDYPPAKDDETLEAERVGKEIVTVEVEIVA